LKVKNHSKVLGGHLLFYHSLFVLIHRWYHGTALMSPRHHSIL